MLKTRLYGYKKPIHAHHTIPVGASIMHIDWHLRNLWTGHTTIIELSKKQHTRAHKTYGKNKGIKKQLKYNNYSINSKAWWPSLIN